MLTEEQRAKKSADYKRWAEANPGKIKANKARYYAKNRDRIKPKNDAYRAAHRADAIIRAAKWRERNPGRAAKVQKEYRQANLDKCRQRESEYRKRNPGKVKAVMSRWRKNNPERCRQLSAKKRAIKKNAAVGDTKAIEKWEKTWRSRSLVKCHWCERKFLGRKCHVDHVVPLSKGGPHILENLCVACENCNCSKHNKMPDAFNKKIRRPLLII